MSPQEVSCDLSIVAKMASTPPGRLLSCKRCEPVVYFANKTLKQQHKLSKHPEPFVCPVGSCFASFSRTSHLQRHIETHRRCGICEEHFCASNDEKTVKELFNHSLSHQDTIGSVGEKNSDQVFDYDVQVPPAYTITRYL